MELLTYNPATSLGQYVEYFWTMRCLRDDLLTRKVFAKGTSGSGEGCRVNAEQANGSDSH
jgi:hypothetical protein